MTRILHIVGDSKYGGGAVLIRRFAMEAMRRGYDTAVLTTDPTFQEQLRLSGVAVVSPDCIWRPIRPLRDLVGLVKLTHYLRRARYDIVHTHTSKAGFVGRLAARFARVPVVIHTVHGFAFHEASSGPALLMYALLEQLAAHFCDALVTVSQFHCDWAARLHIGNARTRTAIPNGIDPARLAPSRDRAPTRAALGIADGELMCLTTGRVVRQKGLDILLHALARYDGPPLRVVLAGEGEELAPLKLMARDLHLGARVMFLGFRTDLGDLLAAADLVVLPSLREGLSISLLEAMAAGKAIIATDIGSNLEVTRHGEAARIVPVGNAAELTGAMMSLAGDAGLRDRLGRAALAEFQRTYHEQMMLDRYMELYARLTGEKCGEVRA